MQLLTKIILKELFSGWGEWGKHEKYYLYELFPSLMKDPSKGTEKEKALILQLKEIASPDELDNQENKLREVLEGNYSINDIVDEIELFISKGDFNKADELFNQINKFSTNELLPYEYENLKKDFCQNTTNKINHFLETHKLEDAENLFLKYSEILKDFDFKGAKIEYLNKKQREDMIAKLDNLLKSDNFSEADRLILQNYSEELLREYEKTKFYYIQNYFRDLEKKLRQKEPQKYENGYFDDEKALVLSTTGNNILVQARAGSGKTEVIALKVRQLIKFYGAKPNEILVLAFNSTAADEFRDRINKYCDTGAATEANTLTFHALAKRISNTAKNLLVDEKVRKDINNRHGKDEKLQIDFLHECFNAVEDRERNLIEKLFFSFLKAATEKIKGAFRNDSEYYLYLRNQQYTTIAGEFVKSIGEKYIADFLFEHQIFKNGKELKYDYECNIKKNLNTKYSYRPDFSLFYTDDEKREQLQAVIEYFGFTSNNSGYPGYFETKKESQKYLKESDEKRKLFSDGKNDFVVMSADDFDRIKINSPSIDNEQIRNQFERVICQRLIDKGFRISERLSEKDILKKISKVERRKKELVKQIAQFINKAQKLSYNPDSLKTFAEVEMRSGNLSKRNESFIKIACRVYNEYLSGLKNENLIDFDGLFNDAIDVIKKDGTQCKIVYHGDDNVIGNIKYILIDEYQDFSELFYKIIQEIRNVNPLISFFCVGDDWQAINGFAGSDLKYFDNFETEYFRNGRRVNLLTNYRSNKNLVLHSNLLMAGLGPGGKPDEKKPDGSIYLSELLRVELRNDEEHINEHIRDKKYLDTARSLLGKDDSNKSIPLEIARYLKTVEYIVRDKVNINKNICLLFRANKLHGLQISKFADKIGGWFPERQKTIKKKTNERDVWVNIDYSTAHSFKGKEKSVVIIVGANRRSFPKFHPDNELMEILGVTTKKVQDEEQRLFYVAITRAREELYLIYDEKIGMSDFISKEWPYLNIN